MGISKGFNKHGPATATAGETVTLTLTAEQARTLLLALTQAMGGGVSKATRKFK